MKRLIGSCLLFLSGCFTSNKEELPEALWYQGKPVHPAVFKAAVTGDAGRLNEPQQVEYKNTNQFIDIIDEQIKWSGNYVQLEQMYRDIANQEIITKICTEYWYCGSYKDRHILLIREFETGTQRDELLLAAFKRFGDTIVNDGEIAFGYRAMGMDIAAVHIDGAKLVYEWKLPIETIIGVLTDKEYSSNDVLGRIRSGLFIQMECDLNAIRTGTQKEVGLALVKELFPPSSEEIVEAWLETDCGDPTDLYFAVYHVGGRYVAQGKERLNRQEAREFGIKVVELLERKGKVLFKKAAQNIE